MFYWNFEKKVDELCPFFEEEIFKKIFRLSEYPNRRISRFWLSLILRNSRKIFWKFFRITLTDYKNFLFGKTPVRSWIKDFAAKISSLQQLKIFINRTYYEENTKEMMLVKDEMAFTLNYQVTWKFRIWQKTLLKLGNPLFELILVALNWEMTKRNLFCNL